MQKLFSKILTIMFLLAFILQLAGLIFLLAVPAPSQAEEKKVYFVPQVGIGDDFQKGDSITVGDSTKMIGDYINAIYKYAIGIVGILAAVVLMFGGVLWITAGGNAERVGNAKSWIGAALTGLVLTLASYTILYTVNPDLVNFKITKIQNVEGDKETIISDDRYSYCKWEVAYSCSEGKAQSDGHCEADTKPASPAYAICCCKISPILGCTWVTYCNSPKKEAVSILDCGSVTHEENETTCCCPAY